MEDLVLNNLIKNNLSNLDINKSLCDLSDLTIIIPTYNRQNFLVRQIIYLSNYNVNLLIADGSEKKIDQKIINKLKNYKDFNYIHSNNLSYVDRIKFASKKIQSKYAMCLAEDDFLVFSGVEKAIQQLKNDTSLSACFGQIAALDYNKFKKKSYLIDYGASLKNYSIRHSNPKDRLNFAFESYRSFSPYAVFNQSQFKEIWSKIDHSFCLELTEYEHAINTLLIGEIKIINELFWIRSQELESLDNKVDGSRKNNFKKWYVDKNFELDVKKFEERTLKNLSYYLDCSQKESAKILKELINCLIDDKKHTGLVNKSYFKKLISFFIKIIKSYSLTNSINNIFKDTYFVIKIKLLIKYLGNKKLKTTSFGGKKKEINKILEITDCFYK